MTIPLFHVDAFTNQPFAGNPAAVCLLPSWKEDRWLQAVAGEMNLSETAFLVKNADGFVSDALKAAPRRALGRATAPAVDRAIRHIW